MSAEKLYRILIKQKLTFFTGVPCSIFRDFLLYLNNYSSGKVRHIFASSEGEAIGIAAGYFISSGNVPVVYMQNSGLGNSVDPLTSLVNKEMYGIPILLFISWRGEPQMKDAVQHQKMGLITLKLLDLLGIPYQIVDENNIENMVAHLKQVAIKNSRPVALIFKKGQITANIDIHPIKSRLMTRKKALEILLEKIGDHPIISNTGKTSREIFEIREISNQKQRDLFILGSLGCVSGVSLGVSLNNKKKAPVYAIDGDGSVLMKMGSLATIGHFRPNLIHIVLDNESHDSTGGQPTASKSIDWVNLFKSLGYKNAFLIRTKKELEELNFKNLTGSCALIVKIAQGSSQSLGRPTLPPEEIKDNFTTYLQ